MYEENLRFSGYKQKITIKEKLKVQECKKNYDQQSEELKKNQIWGDKNAERRLLSKSGLGSMQ